jgi:hypothetical protein
MQGDKLHRLGRAEAGAPATRHSFETFLACDPLLLWNDLRVPDVKMVYKSLDGAVDL